MSVSTPIISGGGSNRLPRLSDLSKLEIDSRPPVEGPLAAELATALEQMADQWHSGHSKSAEQCLADHPELKADPEAAIRIVYEEYCLREEQGERMDTSEILGRFPQWHDALAVLLDCHRLLRNEQEPVHFPSAGQALGELRLLVELGRGALGRVFLATQPSLSDRPLVVKLTARSGQEHLSLARLQHTHIVPLYSVQDFPEENLRALCMPYMGGATWSSVLQSLHRCPILQRNGQHIVECLKQVPRPGLASPAAVGPAAGFLTRSTYVEAVCWIGACLADALSYAHQRGLVHLDIKPSNVLLAGDGQPMLLDFHLACEIDRLRRKTFDRLGGTIAYMSPEQRAAAEALRRGGEVNQQLDGRSDIYSLGVLLYESLAERLPDSDATLSRKSLRDANPLVSRGLEDVIHKCLALKPSARYHDAGQLAADLRFHLSNLPLRGVPNRSLPERWRKWRRRKPYTLPLAAIGVAAFLIVGVVCGLFYRDRIRMADSLLQQSQREFDNRDFESSIGHAQGALNGLGWFPWQTGIREQLKGTIVADEQAQAASALHDFVDHLRFVDGQQISSETLSQLAADCNKLWETRGKFALHSDNRREKQAGDYSLRCNLYDLAILSSRLNLQLAGPAKLADARRARRQRLKEAAELCGESPILELERRADVVDGTSMSSDRAIGEIPTAHEPWEHYAIGRWLMHQGALAEAEQQYRAALDQKPNDFWLNFQLARCSFDLQHFESALVAASVCVALEPSRPECYYNRAVCHESLEQNDEALADFNQSLKLDAHFTPASDAKGNLLSRMQKK
jgi:eukaryotic-like serine/threonine-protein kinase